MEFSTKAIIGAGIGLVSMVGVARGVVNQQGNTADSQNKVEATLSSKVSAPAGVQATTAETTQRAYK